MQFVIPGIPNLLSQPGLLVGLGLGMCIGFLARSNLVSDSSEARRLNDEDEDSDWEDESDADENSCLAEGNGNYKLVLVIRTDLKMGKGKAAAQCCHATLKAYRQLQRINKRMLGVWERLGQPKVVVKVDDEQTLLELAALAQSVNLAVSIIQDAGRTQIAPGSTTVLGIGPGPVDLIDQVTGHLKLY